MTNNSKKILHKFIFIVIYITNIDIGWHNLTYSTPIIGKDNGHFGINYVFIETNYANIEKDYTVLSLIMPIMAQIMPIFQYWNRLHFSVINYANIGDKLCQYLE